MRCDWYVLLLYMKLKLSSWKLRKKYFWNFLTIFDPLKMAQNGPKIQFILITSFFISSHLFCLLSFSGFYYPLSMRVLLLGCLFLFTMYRSIVKQHQTIIIDQSLSFSLDLVQFLTNLFQLFFSTQAKRDNNNKQTSFNSKSQQDNNQINRM